MPEARCSAQPIKRAGNPLRVGAGLVADGPQLDHALPKHRIGDVSDSVFDDVVQPLEFGFCLGRTPAQFGNMRRSAFRALLSTVKHTRKDLLETFGLQQSQLDVLGHNAVQFFHRNGATLAAGHTLPGLGAAV